MSTAYLGLGSNIDAERHLALGIASLRKTFGTVALSPVYRSIAVGFAGDDFLNLAASIQTPIQPLGLKHWLNELERQHGRRRDVPKFSDRALDVDILLYDDLWLVSPELELPRAEVLQYAHVLRPLAELAPDLVHPVLRRTLADIWAAFQGEREGLERVAAQF